jgi:hypothetical protein
MTDNNSSARPTGPFIVTGGAVESHAMKNRQADDRIDEAVDQRIRRRFEACATLPLFPDPPKPPGFFQAPDVGRQLRIFDAFQRDNEPWRRISNRNRIQSR